MVLSIVYLAGGVSSRFGGMIKQLARVGPKGETLIEYSMKQAINAGFDKINMVVGEKTGEKLMDLIGEKYLGKPVRYSWQVYDTSERDKPWGTADALVAARGAIETPFVVCNGDDIYGEKILRKLASHLSKSNESAVIGYNLDEGLPQEGVSNRGMMRIEGDYVKELEEVVGISRQNYNERGWKITDYCSMNLFALHPDMLKILEERVRRFKKENTGNRKVECLLPNEFSMMIKEDGMKMKIYPAGENWIGVTYPEDVLKVRRIICKSG